MLFMNILIISYRFKIDATCNSVHVQKVIMQLSIIMHIKAIIHKVIVKLAALLVEGRHNMYAICTNILEKVITSWYTFIVINI